MASMHGNIPLRTPADQIVIHLVDHVLGSGWDVTFGRYDTTQGTKHDTIQKPGDPAWRMCWAGLFEESQSSDVGRLLDRILIHSPVAEATGSEVVSSDQVSSWLEKQKAAFDSKGEISLLFCSRVVRNADCCIRHIPMMDFRCEPSDRSRHLVISAMKKIGQKHGVVLESGQSYHYYGFDLLDEQEWCEFMYRSLLLTPFSDPRYIGHRLLAKTARLRITGTKTKPAVPRVVANL